MDKLSKLKVKQSNFTLSPILFHRENLLKNKEGIRLSCPETQETGSIITLRCGNAKFATVNIEIHSDDYDVTLHKSLVLEGDDILCIVNQVEHSVRIRKGNSYRLQLRASTDQQSSRTVRAAMFSLLYSSRGSCVRVSEMR